jgi:hypothetical protein
MRGDARLHPIRDVAANSGEVRRTAVPFQKALAADAFRILRLDGLDLTVV